MNNQEIIESVVAKANQWLAGNYDAKTKAEVKAMLDADNKDALIDAFYKDLEFGTGG